METVRFLDPETGQIVTIPASELAPGAIRVRVQGVEEGIVWTLPGRIKLRPVVHPPFSEDLRELIREIQTAFAEHHPMSLEAWEDGFRRDANSEVEIALWLRAADVYTAFLAQDPSASQRREAYRCLIACMNAVPDTIWEVFEPRALSREQAEWIVQRFYRRRGH